MVHKQMLEACLSQIFLRLVQAGLALVCRSFWKIVSGTGAENL